MSAPRACRVCGCTDDRACPGGCDWVEDPVDVGDVCSNCLSGDLEHLDQLQLLDAIDLRSAWIGVEMGNVEIAREHMQKALEELKRRAAA